MTIAAIIDNRTTSLFIAAIRVLIEQGGCVSAAFLSRERDFRNGSFALMMVFKGTNKGKRHEDHRRPGAYLVEDGGADLRAASQGFEIHRRRAVEGNGRGRRRRGADPSARELGSRRECTRGGGGEKIPRPLRRHGPVSAR